MRLQRPLLAAALLVSCAAVLPAQARLRVMPSGRATTEVSFAYPRDSAPAGFTSASLKVDYGQPHLRGRALHADTTFVPYDRPWRTGANAATTLTTGVDLELGGHTLARGTYVLWTLPTRAGWTLVVQRSGTPAQAEGRYDQANDVARIPLRVQTLASPVESLTISLIPSTAPGTARGELRMAWGTTQLATDWAVR